MIRGVWLSAGDVVAVVSGGFAGPSTGARTIRPSPRGVVGVIAILLVTLALKSAAVEAQGFPYENWMGDLAIEAPEALDQTLARFIFPGSHDAGTYDLKHIPACDKCQAAEHLIAIEEGCGTGNGPFGIAPLQVFLCSSGNDGFFLEEAVRSFAKAQGENIFVQLLRGSRSFDLRFFRANAIEASRTDPFSGESPLTEDRFYIHHTLAGPDLDEILAQFSAFLARHPGEILLLIFRKMMESDESGTTDGDGEMTPGSFKDFFEEVFFRIGDFMAPRSFGDQKTVREFLDKDYQVIVSFGQGGDDPRLSDLPMNIQDLIWPESDNESVLGDTSNYPKAEFWDTENEMLALMKQRGDERERKNAEKKMWRMDFALGSDNAGLMIKRKFLCGPPFFGILDEFVSCPAINSNWDKFQSLEEVADYTHPTLLGSLVGLPRDDVNIVHIDHYPEEFTAEVIKLTKGAARVEFLVRKVKEIDCHDCLPLLSDPDYYPFIEILPSDWPAWGGPHLERTDEDPLFPEWLAVRSVASEDPLEITLKILDDDDFGSNDQSDLTPGSGKTLTVDFGGAPVRLLDCSLDAALCFDLANELITEGKDDSFIPSEVSKVTYSIGICDWPMCPDSDPSADLGITLSAAPDPVPAPGTLTYTVTVINKGPFDAHNVTVNHRLPSSPMASGADCRAFTNFPFTHQCQLSPIPAGGMASYTVTVTVDANAPFEITSRATVFESSGIPDDVPDNNSDTLTIEVVGDTTPPVARCQDVTVSLDASGAGSTTASAVNSGSTDDRGIASTTLSKTSFGCGDIGSNTVTLTVTDTRGNSDTCTAAVTVQDTLLPTALCQAATVGLDGAGLGSITTADVDAGSTDACGVSLSLDDDLFSCADVGSNLVELTATDPSGNVNNCTSSVAVGDDTPPSVTCPADLSLECTGASTVATFAPTLSDNCISSATSSCSIDSGSGFDLGNTTVECTGTDGSDNPAAPCEFQVQVVDMAPPSITCPTVPAAECTGNDSAAVTFPPPTASDICTAVTTGCTADSGDRFPLGDSTLSCTATDTTGNQGDCDSIIRVEDTTAPTITCPDDITAECTGESSAPVTPGAASGDDVCGDVSVSSHDPGSFPLGTAPLTYTATDGVGLTASCMSNIVVEDSTPPSILCPAPATIECTGNQSAPFTPAPASATDICAGVTVSNPAAGSFGLGTTALNYSAIDEVGLTASCTSTVTVVDTTKPSVVEPSPTTASADGGCLAAVPDLTTAITTFDNCTASAALTITQDPTPGTLVSLGTHTITLMVTDEADNSENTTTTFTVVDTTAPVVACSITPVVGGGDDDDDDDDVGGPVQINFSATDNCSAPEVLAVLGIGCEQLVVSAGQVIDFECDGDCEVEPGDDDDDDDDAQAGILEIGAQTGVLNVTATDDSGNVGNCSTTDLCPPLGDDDDDDDDGD